jgi:transcriptional regulator with XRE-family HTH domain
MSVDFKIIGIKAREARIHNRMSQADLAERINMSVTYTSHIETAKKQASLEALVRIANVLGVTVDYLVTILSALKYRASYEVLSTSKHQTLVVRPEYKFDAQSALNRSRPCHRGSVPLI